MAYSRDPPRRPQEYERQVRALGLEAGRQHAVGDLPLGVAGIDGSLVALLEAGDKVPQHGPFAHREMRPDAEPELADHRALGAVAAGVLHHPARQRDPSYDPAVRAAPPLHALRGVRLQRVDPPRLFLAAIPG